MSRLYTSASGGLVYDHIVGTGGIGSGIFFAMKGDHTLGRNESRMAELLPYKDFCKQHIIMHYIAVLLGAGSDSGFRSYPIGKVGDDAIGRSLIGQMEATGMDIRNVYPVAGFSTLFSVCYQYPDQSGGNITTDNGASSQVAPGDIACFFSERDPGRGKEIILAAPEVPLAARIALLEYGRERKSFNIAAIQSSEVASFSATGGFALTDLVSLNIDEAAKVADAGPETTLVEIVQRCIDRLTGFQPSIIVLITNGAQGVYAWQNGSLTFTPAFNVDVRSTAGAGDAFLAGTITGLCLGLPLKKPYDDSSFGETPVDSAVELGAMLAAFSVTSQDTIHAGADARSLKAFALDKGIAFSKRFADVFNL